MKFFLIIGGRTQPVIFIFTYPSGLLQLTRFLFSLRQPDSNKLLMAYVFYATGSIRIPRVRERQQPFPAPLVLLWRWAGDDCTACRKPWKARGNSVRERVWAMKCSKHQHDLSELQRSTGCIAYLWNKRHSAYDVLWVFRVLAAIVAGWPFGGFAVVSV